MGFCVQRMVNTSEIYGRMIVYYCDNYTSQRRVYSWMEEFNKLINSMRYGLMKYL
jgi:hypothetical protein